MTDKNPAAVRTWPVLLLAAPAFVAIWGGWVGLGKMAGFGEIDLLPGITELTINSAITLPIGMETYAAYALHVWLSNNAAHPTARAFAKWSAIGALILGALGQVAYHLLRAEHDAKTAKLIEGVTDPKRVTQLREAAELALAGSAPIPIVVLVACLPVAVLGMGAALAHLMRATRHDAEPVHQAAAANQSTGEPETSPVDHVVPVHETASVDRSMDDDETGPVDLSKIADADQSEAVHPDQSTETDTNQSEGPVRNGKARPVRTSRPRTARRTSPKVRPIESGTTNRLKKLREDFPQSIPSNGEIKKSLGIKSQGTADNLRKALIAERSTTTKEAVK